MGPKKRGSGLRGPFVCIIVLLAAGFCWRYFYFDSFSALGSYVLPTTTKFVEVAVEAPCQCTLKNDSCPHDQKQGGEEKVKIVVEEKIVEKVVEIESKSKPWFAKGKPWHAEGQFALCSMDVCFNFSQCENQEELLIYYYDVPSPPVRYFQGLNSTSWYTPDPEAACLLFIFQDWEVFDGTRTQPYDLPQWNYGLNHVVVTFADLWFQRNPPPNRLGNASVISSTLFETTYRPGFDIGIPLPGRWHNPQLQTLRPFQRRFFLTFRGTRYVDVSGEGIFRSYDSFRNMHNGKDVVIAPTCKHPINDEKRKEHPELGAGCDEDQKIYDSYDFVGLMNSTFALAPAGISSSSYRLIEVLSAGAIPVIIADNFVKPFENIIQWPRCMLQFPTDQMHRILPALRGMAKKEVRARQKYCLWVYDEFLKDDATLLRSVIRALKARFYGVFASFSDQASIYTSSKNR